MQQYYKQHINYLYTPLLRKTNRPMTNNLHKLNKYIQYMTHGLLTYVHKMSDNQSLINLYIIRKFVEVNYKHNFITQIYLVNLRNRFH